MSLNQARIDIFTYIKNNWTYNSVCPLVFEGQNTGDKYLKEQKSFIYITVDFGKWYQKSPKMGKTLFENSALVSFRMQIHQKDGVGAKDQYTDALFNLLTCKQIGDCSFKTISVNKDGQDDPYYIRIASIWFELRKEHTFI